MPATSTDNTAKILIVDDNELHVDLLCDILAAYPQKYDVVAVAYDGPEGERLARETSPDIVLIDILMPLQNGFDVIRQMKLQKHGDKLKFIVMSAFADPELLKPLPQLGVEGFYYKDEHAMDKIPMVIDRVHAGETYFEAWINRLRPHLSPFIPDPINLAQPIFNSTVWKGAGSPAEPSRKRFDIHTLHPGMHLTVPDPTEKSSTRAIEVGSIKCIPRKIIK